MSSVACSGTPPLITATRRVIFFLPGLTHFFSPHPVDEGINQPSLKGFCRVDFGAKITRRVNERDGREIKTPRQKLGPGCTCSPQIILPLEVYIPRLFSHFSPASLSLFEEFPYTAQGLVCPPFWPD